MKLYEIDNAIGAFQPEIDEETGELLNADALDALQMERDRKIEAICLVIKNMDAEMREFDTQIGILTEEVAAIKARSQSKQKERDSLKRYLQKSLNGEKFETARCAVSYRKNPDTANVYDPEAFMAWAKQNAKELVNVNVSETPNKPEIKKWIAGGKEVKGARIDVGTTTMIVK